MQHSNIYVPATWLCSMIMYNACDSAVTKGVSLGWISEPYIPWLHAVTFTSTEWLRVGVPVHRDPFQIVLRNITSNSSQTSLTSILSFIATSTLNGTVVECDSDRMTARITFHIAGTYYKQVFAVQKYMHGLYREALISASLTKQC